MNEKTWKSATDSTVITFRGKISQHAASSIFIYYVMTSTSFHAKHYTYCVIWCACCEKYSTFFLGDLVIKNMSKNRTKNQISISLITK